MTETDWLECDDPDVLLAAVSGAAAPGALRRLACLGCRRILEKRPIEFGAGYWRGEQVPALLAAVAAAEAWEADGAAAKLLAPEIAAAAASHYSTWQWANYRLGDTASGGDYENAYLGWKIAAAVSACCAEDIRVTVADCLRSAAEAIGFRWEEKERAEAIAAERRAQSALIRRVLEFPDATRTPAPAPPERDPE